MIYDQQTGKNMTGEVRNITPLSFELWDRGERIGRFSRDNLPKESTLAVYAPATLQGEEEGKDIQHPEGEEKDLGADRSITGAGDTDRGGTGKGD